VDAASAELSGAVSEALSAAGVAHSIQRAGSLFSIAFGEFADGGPRSYDEVRAQEAFRYPPFFHALLDRGVSAPPSVFEAWFLSAAHDEVALGRIIDALPAAARAAAGTG